MRRANNAWPVTFPAPHRRNSALNRNALSRCIEKTLDGGSLFEDIARRVAYPTESRNPARATTIRQFLNDEITPALTSLGFSCRIVENPALPRLPFLLGKRIEGKDLPTVLLYGHGDTIQGMDEKWKKGLSPWHLTSRGNRWYGRGTADNKGQFSVNLAALKCVLETRETLGYNVTILIETGEEMGSPGLKEVCARERKTLAADVMIASDGPRVDPEKVTLYGGSRGVFNFDLVVNLREGPHHSGNWGGLLANPGILLANAIAALVDGTGRILIDALKPTEIPPVIRKALGRLKLPKKSIPPIDIEWGEPALSPEEKVYGWNTLEVLTLSCGDPKNPVHAIPPSAWARCHIRYVKGCDPEAFLPAIRRRLDTLGLSRVEVRPVRESLYAATRMEPDDPWITWALASLERIAGYSPDFLPNLGGSIPNEAFSIVLGLPTLWIPHSYAGCNQHAPNEHLLLPIIQEGLHVMAGLFWDLAENFPGKETTQKEGKFPT